jgi:lysophospholipase L1-like esterase
MSGEPSATQLMASGATSSSSRQADQQRNMESPPVNRKIALFIASLLLSLLIIEVACRFRERIQAREHARRQAIPIADTRLGQRMPPNRPDYDARGFRNRTVPANADIVAIGDSQTWGVNVEREDAWPQDLQKISHHTVYNMSLGGFGPIQYMVLSQEALELSPKVVIVAVYLGNDLFDAYSLAYRNDLYAGLRSPESGDLAHDTISQKVDGLYKEILAADSIRGPATFFVAHSAILRFLMIPASEYWYASAWARSHPDRYAVYDKGGVKTVLTTGYRLSAVDLDEPRILEGLKITQRSLAKIRESMNDRSVKLLVVIIPTKEAVFAPSAGSVLDPTYERLMHMEGSARQQLVDFCESNGIQVFDPLPALSQAVASRSQIYPQDTDGHPNAAGYNVLASAIYERLRSLQWIN